MDLRVGLEWRLSTAELMLLNCGAGEDSWESLGCKEIQAVSPNGNQSWVFTGRTDAEAEAPYFGHLMQRADSLEKTLMLGKLRVAEGGRHRMRWMDGVINSMDMSLSKLRRWWRTGKPDVLQSMGSQRVGHKLAPEQQQNTWSAEFN